MIRNIQSSSFVAELKKKARQTHTPIYGTFELTSRCNFNCKMCYVHNENALSAKSKELSTEQWKSIFDQAIAEGLLFALFTGGECLLRDDFDDLYLYLYNKGIVMSVNTNASLIDEARAAFFEKYPPERIQISIYGSSEDNYEMVTERRAFAKVCRALELLEEHHLRPEIAITVSKYMKDIDKILSFVVEKKYAYNLVTGLIAPRDGASVESTALSNDEIVRIKIAERRAKGTQLKLHSTPAPKAGCRDECNESGMPCNAGTIRAGITHEGEMVPCMAITNISKNVLDFGFHECWSYIWNEMMLVQQPSNCKSCYYKKQCVFCPALRYDGLFSGKCKEEYCELMINEYNHGVI